MAHDERDARLFAHGDNPPPRPHPATTTSYPHPSSTPKKCHPCARSKVSPMSPIAQPPSLDRCMRADFPPPQRGLLFVPRRPPGKSQRFNHNHHDVMVRIDHLARHLQHGLFSTPRPRASLASRRPSTLKGIDAIFRGRLTQTSRSCAASRLTTHNTRRPCATFALCQRTAGSTRPSARMLPFELRARLVTAALWPIRGAPIIRPVAVFRSQTLPSPPPEPSIAVNGRVWIWLGWPVLAAFFERAVSLAGSDARRGTSFSHRRRRWEPVRGRE